MSDDLKATGRNEIREIVKRIPDDVIEGMQAQYKNLSDAAIAQALYWGDWADACTDEIKLRRMIGALPKDGSR